MATIHGVYTGTVLDNRDPDGVGRVLVRMPAAAATTVGDVWARVATMMAGRNRGTFFIPDAGDEVLVAFEGGELARPCVIGSLWNAKARPPAAAGDAAAVSLIRSRHGLTVRLRDDAAGNSLVIETATGQRLTLQDTPGAVRIEDGNGNALTLDAAGVTVTSVATVTVQASVVEVSAASVTVNAGMTKCSGVVQCDTLVANSVVASSYTPGAGNIW